MHSHLIPGIDDGSRDIASSIEMIKGLHELGFEKLITTPHVLWEIYPNTSDIITNGIADVRKAVQESSLKTELHAAAEYYIDDHFEEELEKNSSFTH